MTVQITDRHLEQLEQDERAIVVVQDPRTKQRFVVLPQDTYNRARALFEYVTMQSADEPSETAAADIWSDDDNSRRVVLINKKHDTRLAGAEERELDELQQRAYRYRARVAPVRNELLRLLVEALENRGPRGRESA